MILVELKRLLHGPDRAAALVIPLLLLGCGKEHPAASGTTATNPVVAAALASKPVDPVDLAAFLKAFESADTGLKVYADETAAVIRTRAFRDALEQLGKLSSNPKITAAQRQAVADLTTKLQAMTGGR